MQLTTEIVQSVFRTMLGMDVFGTDQSRCSSISERYTACVFLEGDWDGALSFECDRKNARCFTAQLLGLEPDQVTEDDVRDAVGELANMIGGNLKSRLATNVRLSVPTVIYGNSYEVKVCAARLVECMAFTSVEGDSFWVSLLESTRKPV